MSMMGSSSTSEYIDIVGDNLTDITTVATEVTAKLKTVEGFKKSAAIWRIRNLYFPLR